MQKIKLCTISEPTILWDIDCKLPFSYIQSCEKRPLNASTLNVFNLCDSEEQEMCIHNEV